MKIAARDIKVGDKIEGKLVKEVGYDPYTLIGGPRGTKAALRVVFSSGDGIDFYPGSTVEVEGPPREAIRKRLVLASRSRP